MNINLSSVPRFRTGAYGAMVPDDSGEFVKVADIAGAEETHSLQCWPDGRSFTYRGDIHAPTIDVRVDGVWRTATEEEHGQIKINVLANLYADRDVFCCDSSLVSDLIEASCELPRDMAREFGVDEIRNMIADPSDWGLERCRDYINDLDTAEGFDVDPWTMTREELAEALAAVDIEVRDDETVETLREAVIANIDDETIDGIDEWREKARALAQDNPAEVYEWWRVSSWLCAALDSIGEVTIDNGYGYWWGRTCTGQGFIMDGVFQRVAAR